MPEPVLELHARYEMVVSQLIEGEHAAPARPTNFSKDHKINK